MGRKGKRSYKQYQKNDKGKKGKNKKVSQMTKGEAFSEMTAMEPSQVNSKRWEQLCVRSGQNPNQRRKQLMDEGGGSYSSSYQSRSTFGSFKW